LWGLADVLGSQFFHRMELVPLFKVAILFVMASSFLDFVLQLFQAYEEWGTEGLLSAVYPLLYLAVAWIAVGVWHAGLDGVLLANAFAAGLTAVLGWVILRNRHRWQVRQRWEYGTFRASTAMMVGFGAPMVVGQVSFVLLNCFDKALLGKYGSLESVTFYYIAASFLAALMALFKVLFTVCMPYLAGIDETDAAGVERKFILMFRWFLQTAVVTALVAYFAVEPVILLLYGHDYYPAVEAFRWLLPVFLLRAAHNPSGMFVINVFEKTAKATSLGVLLAAVSVILNLVLVPSHGLYGAIWAGIVAYLIYWVVLLSVFREIGRMFPYRACLRTLGVVLLVGSGGLLLRGLGLGSGMVLGPTCLIAYVVLLFVFREIEPADIELFKGSLTGLRIGRQA